MWKIYQSLIAKTGKESTQWLSLPVHLRDTAEIMKYLVNEYISPSFCDACGLPADVLIDAAKFLAGVHDIGKATLAFQFKISTTLPVLRSRLSHCGLHFPDYYDADKMRKTPHGLAGEVILRYLGCPAGVAAVVGAHHGVPCSEYDVKDQALDLPSRDIIGKENYFGRTTKINRPLLQDVWETILQEALRETHFSSVKDLPHLTNHAQVLLTGLLIMADWIASNADYFPLMNWEDQESQAVSSKIRAQHAWRTMDFTAMWESGRTQFSDVDFEDCFGFRPRSVQQAVIRSVADAQQPGIMILEAPMGCGKTEAALAAGEIMAAKLHKSGLFFGLPTQATANGIFPRILHWCEQQSLEDYHAIQLRHGGADLNPCFQEIQRGIPEEETDSGVIVHEWFCNPKKACLSEFVVATVDHLLMMALQRKAVMLLHLGLSQKVVIIDECHAYDAYMNRYLTCALEWLGAYHTPVILLSATLPAKRRMELVRAYLHQSHSDPKLEESLAYPLLTWTDGTEIHQAALPYTDTSRHVEIARNTWEHVLPEVTAAASDGCAGVIVNTVKRAQQIAAQLKEQTDAQVLLFHAQFTHPDRAVLEQKLLERIGKHSGKAERTGLIVVGTQVLEQSLDIDFDLLVTDICPMDLLLQRIGRLHRHPHHDAERPVSLQTARCIVLTEEMESEQSGSRRIYGDWLLEETLAQLPEHITLPGDISVLVQGVYHAKGEGKAFAEYQFRTEQKTSKATCFLLDKVHQKSIHNLLDRCIHDSKDDARAEAAVRDGLASIEVLLMQRDADGTVHFLPHCGGAAVAAMPEEDVCRKIAEQKLRLPSVFSQQWNIDRAIAELEEQCNASISGWQHSPWLKGKLVLFLDEKLHTELCGYALRYSPESGLICVKKEEEHEGNGI